jgi:hypothetical protein
MHMFGHNNIALHFELIAVARPALVFREMRDTTALAPNVFLTVEKK